MSDGLRFTGQDGMAKNAQTAYQDARRGMVRGLELGTHLILDVSNDQVPHEEGDLERDGAASVDEGTLRGAVSYGRGPETAKYAVPQHERLDFRHDAGRNAKFLENAFNSEANAVGQIIAEQTRKGLNA